MTTFNLTLLENNETYNVKIDSDIFFVKPFGIFITSSLSKKERFFSNKIWCAVEIGNYADALTKTDSKKFNVVVDNEKKYTVSQIEFDGNGVLTLSLSKDAKNIWSLVLSPTYFNFITSSSYI